MRFFTLASLLAAASGASAFGDDTDLPGNLVVDVRVFESRASNPDFDAMENLAFFIDTDGTGVTHEAWLATIARRVKGSFLAILATEALPVKNGLARLEIENRSQSLDVTVGLREFRPRGGFEATIEGALATGERTARRFRDTVELRLGRTFIWSDAALELSATEYLSHFRDYNDRQSRGALYETLRDQTFFVILALTPRLAAGSEPVEPVSVSLPRGAEIPEFHTSRDALLVGTIVLEFDVDETGSPRNIEVVRSSIPEVNPRIVGEASSWRFPDASGRRARIELELETR